MYSMYTSNILVLPILHCIVRVHVHIPNTYTYIRVREFTLIKFPFPPISRLATSLRRSQHRRYLRDSRLLLRCYAVYLVQYTYIHRGTHTHTHIRTSMHR